MNQHESNTPSVPILSSERVRELISPKDALSAILATFKDHGRSGNMLSEPAALRLVHTADNHASFKIKGAHVPGQAVAGFRIIADLHSDSGETSIDYCWVADARTGQIKGLVDETWLHRLRTATTAVVAAKLLARADSSIVTIVGAGQIAEELPAVLRAAFDISEIRIVSRRVETAKAFAAKHGAESAVAAFDNVDDAMPGTDIVITISSASEPVLHARHLQPGMTVCGLGGGHEIDIGALSRADRFVVDDLGYATTIGSVHGWLQAGSSLDDIRAGLSAEIGSIATGQAPGRMAKEEIVLAIIQGMASGDVALANLALDRAAGGARN